MSSSSFDSDDLTQLLQEWDFKSVAQTEQILLLIWDELKRISHQNLMKNADVTLETGELVNELYLRLTSQKKIEVNDRHHFFKIAAKLIRQILIERYRKKNASRRGANPTQVFLPIELMLQDDQINIVALDDALDALKNEDPQLCSVVELRYFAGLSNMEVGEVLKISEPTVKRKWRVAKTFLHEYMEL